MDNCHCILILVRFWCWKKVGLSFLRSVMGKRGFFFSARQLKDVANVWGYLCILQVAFRVLY